MAENPSVAAIPYDLTVEQGATKHVTYYWQQPDAATLAALVLDPELPREDYTWEPKSTTGYDARMQIKNKQKGTATVYAELSSDADEGITLGGVDGSVAVRIKATQTAAIPKDGFYDLELVLTADAEEVIRLAQGQVLLDPEVTTT